MMRTLSRLALVTATVTLSAAAHAQFRYEPKNTDTSTAHAVTHIYEQLFDGVRISPAAARRAKVIIMAETKAQRAVNGRAPGGWEKRIELITVRDSTLRLLLSTDAERKRFDLNALDLRPVGTMPRAQPASLQPTARHLAVADARLSEEFTLISAVRELSDGRVLISDEREVRVVVADFKADRISPVGRQGNGPSEYGQVSQLLAIRGDSTIIPVPFARRWVLTSGGTAAVTLPADAPAVASVDAGYLVGSDGGDRLLAHIMPMGAGARLPDSLAFIRLDRSTGKSDTVAHSPMPRVDAAMPMTKGGAKAAAGKRRFVVAITSTDQGVMFSDGTVAIVRPSPYRVDWCPPRRPCANGPTLELPVRMTDGEKRAYLEHAARTTKWPPTTNVDETVGWPEFVPPFASPPRQTHAAVAFAAADGSVVIARMPTVSAPPQRYDIVNREGRLAAILMLAPNERIVGFGQKSVYVAVTDDNGVQTLRRHPWT